MSVNSQEEKFKKKLTSEQYRILRQKGTEAPFTGDLLHNKDSGMYKCAACGADLFSSQHKFDSGTGWPSFYDVAQSGAVKLEEDSSLGMSRVEAVCTNCGKRYCINSVCLAFDPKNRQD
jgi:peptide-methionine (R)-S-oxide reductase